MLRRPCLVLAAGAYALLGGKPDRHTAANTAGCGRTSATQPIRRSRWQPLRQRPWPPAPREPPPAVRREARQARHPQSPPDRLRLAATSRVARLRRRISHRRRSRSACRCRALSPPPDIQKTAPTARRCGAAARSYFSECDMCPVMVVVPPGSNRIGSPEDERGRERMTKARRRISPSVRCLRSDVRKSRSRNISPASRKADATPDRPGDYGWGYDKQPAINVSWNDAKAYVAWLSKKTGATYRLLSEAEWEYVARGCARVCEPTPFWFGEDISKARANYNTRYCLQGQPARGAAEPHRSGRYRRAKSVRPAAHPRQCARVGRRLLEPDTRRPAEGRIGTNDRRLPQPCAGEAARGAMSRRTFAPPNEDGM